MSTIKKIALVTLPILLWSAFIGYGFIDGFLLRSISSKSTPEAFVRAAEEHLKGEYVGNFAMILIENGEIAGEHFHTIDQPVDQNTMFPVASISKWVTSFGVMKLVEKGKLDLDKPIDDYLSRWKLPESEFDNRKVTTRRLLSHSAGLVDGLGYGGFKPGEKVQTIAASLTKAADAPYSDGVAKVGYEPGSQYMYSGAGYTILQLLIEEVTGRSFQNYMQEEVLIPLGMQNSVFGLPEKREVETAQIFTTEGTIRQPNRFTALAAAALFTSTADLSKFLLANITENAVVSEETIATMTSAQTFINKIGYYGLGPSLYSQNDKNSNIVGHDGSGNNAINTAARIDLVSKSGIIILETGHYNMASSLADEWMFWKAGIADYVVMQRNIPFVLSLLGMGSVLIVIISIVMIRRKT
ncbi:MAG: beta-lactamase family protein [Saprospiraceae bacterium]|nr:beta-lactamase family protein [Saprospiraceae bacterium]